MADTNRVNVDLDILDYYDGKIKDYVDDKVSTGGLTIDTVLSDTSENVPQTKVVKQAIDEKADKTVATTTDDGLMSAEDKVKLDGADNTYALKSKYGDTTIDVGRKSGSDVGDYSAAEGKNSIANGYASHAEGSNTTAIGTNSHSEGRDTLASGVDSHAGGTGTKALHTSEVAYGRYNESNDDTLFSVGDGTSEDSRHNAIEITTTGGKLHDNDIATTNQIINENLLINPNFKINQRGSTGNSVSTHQGLPISASQQYIVDRWRNTLGNVTVTNGVVTLNGTLIQVLENSIGTDFTATVSVASGTASASYDDSTKTYTIVGENAVLNWAKLEYGKTATAFVPPNRTTELLKCQRYYQVIIPGAPIFSYAMSSSVQRFPWDIPVGFRKTPSAVFEPITGDYTWSIILHNIVSKTNITFTDVPLKTEVVVKSSNTINIMLTFDTTDATASDAYLIMGMGGFRIMLDAEIY